MIGCVNLKRSSNCVCFADENAIRTNVGSRRGGWKNKMLMAYRKQEKEKLPLRVFVNRSILFIYKIIIVVSDNRRN